MPDILYGLPPIYGSFEFNQKNSSEAFMTFKNTAGTQVAAVTKLGHINLRRYTTAPTTGLTKNDLFLVYHNSVPRLAVCTSTAGNIVKFIRARTKTNGRLTA